MTSTESQPQHTARLMQMIIGYQITQIISVAAKLGISDLLADGAKTSQQLAEATGVHAPSLYRVLRMLASLEIFAEDEQGRFGLTPMAELLQHGVPGSLNVQAMIHGEAFFWQTWGDLMHSVKTGETAVSHLFGTSAWEYRAQNPDDNAIFNDLMTSISMLDNPAIMKAYDFSGVNTLVDVAGGQGAFLAAILNAYPAMHGILFDQPHVVSDAEKVLETAGVKGRYQLVSGNFFEALPFGGDAYVLKHVVHDWEDESAVAILQTCRRSMTPQAKLLLVESVIPSGNTVHRSKLLDVHMLAGPGGRERTEDEYRALFKQTGFTLTRLFPTATGESVIEGIPA